VFKEKAKYISKNFLLPILLVIFVAGRSVLLVHSFSHQEFNQGINGSKKIQQVTIQDKNILEKIIFVHSGNSSDSAKKAADCSLCTLSNLQNQVLFSSAFAFVVMAFYLAFISRDFNRVKLSYLLFSYSSRAPPQVS
jgi:hypothetical protein